MSDLISRQAAISALGEEPEVWMDDDDYTLGQRNQWRYDVTVLKALPSVQPERKKGRWIKVSGKTAINCSACHHCSWSLSFEDTVRRFNFCPNCGADMRQKEGRANENTQKG